MILTNDKLLNFLILTLIFFSFFIISLSIKNLIKLIQINERHEQLINYIKEANVLNIIEMETSIFLDYYSKFLTIYTNHEIENKSNEIKIAKQEIKKIWNNKLEEIIMNISIFETIIPFLGWLATFYYVILTNATSKIALWPLSFGIIILSIIILFKKYFIKKIYFLKEDLENFEIILNSKFKQIVSNTTKK